MDNYKFTSLLSQTTLTNEEKHNLTVIFNSLTNERKFEIIENWQFYYGKILSVHNMAEAEKSENIRATFEKINNLISEAVIRDEERKRKEQEEQEKQKEDYQAAQFYDMQQKMAQLRNIGRP